MLENFIEGKLALVHINGLKTSCYKSLQANTWTNASQDSQRHMTSIDHNELKWISFKMMQIIFKLPINSFFAHDRHTGFVVGACATFDIIAMNSMVAYFPSKFN